MKKLHFSALLILLFSLKSFSQCTFSLSVNPVNVTCFGLCNGSASVSVTGGTGSFTYMWSPGGASGTSISALCPSTYKCIVEEAGCKDSVSFSITQPSSVLSVSITPVNQITCHGMTNGSTGSSVTGGSSPYNYSWSTIPIETAPNAFNLVPGTLTLVVTDLYGCTDTATENIIEPPPIIITPITTTSVTCFGGNNGAASLSASGGVPSISGYTYLWSPSAGSNNSATGLSAGIYTFSVTDSLSCTVTHTITINQPSAYSVVAAQTNVCGGTTADVTATASGGTPSFNYSWMPGNYSTQSVSGIAPGAYTVVVTDARSCTASDTITLLASPAISTTLTTTNISCQGDTNGTASIAVAGGTPYYNYLWQPNGETTSNISNLSSGNYTITVTDSAGCLSMNTFVIGGATLLSTTLTPTHICETGTGSATINVGGGTPTYQYSWSTSETTSTISGLAPGSYTCTVVDSLGCSDTSIFRIFVSVDLDVTITTTPIICNGDSNATITALGGSGKPPYSYLWNPGGETSSTISGLASGTYSITVTDSIGCTINQSVVIINPPLLTLTVTGTDPICNGCNNGTANATAGGGTGAYTYSWSSAQTTANVTGLVAGVYTVCVTDSLGCEKCDQVTLLDPPWGIADNDLLNKLKINPVPFGGYLQIKYEAESPFILSINNIIGETLYTENVNSKLYTRIIDTSSFPDGIYVISLANPGNPTIALKVVKAGR